MKPTICEIEISKSMDKKISQLIKSGHLSRENGVVYGLEGFIRHAWAQKKREKTEMKPIEFFEVDISRKFLNTLGKDGLVVFDRNNRVYRLDRLLIDLMHGRSLDWIQKARKKEEKRIIKLNSTPTRRRH